MTEQRPDRDHKDPEKAGLSKKELRREIFPFLICGAAICAVCNVFTGIPGGNALGAALTGVVFGYVVWGFWRFFTKRR